MKIESPPPQGDGLLPVAALSLGAQPTVSLQMRR